MPTVLYVVKPDDMLKIVLARLWQQNDFLNYFLLEYDFQDAKELYKSKIAIVNSTKKYLVEEFCFKITFYNRF